VITGVDRPAWEVFRTSGIDLVFEPANFYGWRLPIPAIAWVPDFQHRRLPHLFTRSAWIRRELGLRAQIASGRQIMVSSHSAKADCLRFYPGTKGRIHVVRFAVAANAEQDLDNTLQCVSRFGLPERFFFLPNQLWSHKNHSVAIEAAAILEQMGDTSVIIATGHGNDHRSPGLRDELQARIDSLGVRKTFRFLGDLNYADVRALALCCTAMINPSRFEGWSTTVEEAKASGTPMILSDLDVHLEQAPGAHFFDPNDPARLATIIRAMPARSKLQIERDRTRAAVQNEEARKAFARDFALLVDTSLER
jgi:glycosyltransferase involved in cell wall biosynthesis